MLQICFVVASHLKKQKQNENNCNLSEERKHLKTQRAGVAPYPIQFNSFFGRQKYNGEGEEKKGVAVKMSRNKRDSLKALSQVFALLLILACEKHEVEKIKYKLKKRKLLENSF